MRTLKKTLCLVLAVVMVLGLCAFGVSAEFNDADKIQYSEAADVLNAIGVIKGTGAGDFDPAKELTRAEGATIIARLLGQNSENGTAPFDDCDSVNSWAGFAIDYCASQGIIAGDGNGHFLPTQPLTGSAFAKMLLTALGYDAEIEGLTGASWEVGVAKLIRSISLDDGIDDFDQTKAIDRETAAQLAFTALTETMVYYPSRIDSSDGSINTNLQTTNVGEQLEAWTDGYKSTSTITTPATPYTQLCEKYFPKLKLNVDDTDADGRSANTWTFKGSKVTTTAKDPKYKTVAGTTKTYKDIIEDYNKTLKFPGGASITTTVYQNGAQIGNGAAAASTSNAALATNARVGDVIELYVKDDDVTQISNVVITHYSANKVSAAVATRTSNGVDQVRVPGVVNSWTNIDDVIGYEGLEKDDIVYYYKAANGVYHLFKAESFDGVLTAMAPVDGTTPAKYTISGTKYSINDSTGEGGDQGATNQKYNDTYKYYTDDNDFIIWSTLVESGSKDYVLVYDLKYLASSASSGLGTNGSAEARLVFMDGSTKVVTIDKIDDYIPVDFSNAGTAVAASDNTLDVDGGGFGGTAAGSVYVGYLPTTINKATTTTIATTALVAGSYYNLSTVTPGAANSTINARYLALSSVNTGANANATKARLYTYTIGSNGKYTLTSALNQSTVDGSAAINVPSGTPVIQAKSSKLGSAANNVAVNDDTVFVVMNSSASANDPKFTVYTGKNNCPTFTNNTALSSVNFTYATEKGVATHVVVTSFDTSSGGTYVYLLEGSSHERTTIKQDDGTSTRYWVYSAYVEGDDDVKDIYLTDNANTIVTNAGHGIGLYTSPEMDSYGNYDKLVFETAGDSSAERNQTFALGWNMSGTTLQTSRTYDNSPVWNRAYDCPADAIYILKDDGFTVGTAADMSDDPNDQIYVALTNKTDNKVQLVYVVKRDADNTGVSSVSTVSPLTATYAAVAQTATVLDKYGFGTTPTVTVEGKAYTVPHYDAGLGGLGGNVYINLDSRCKVTYLSLGTLASNTYVGAVAASLTETNCKNATVDTAIAITDSGVGLTVAAGETYIVRIQAEDGETLGFITISED